MLVIGYQNAVPFRKLKNGWMKTDIDMKNET